MNLPSPQNQKSCFEFHGAPFPSMSHQPMEFKMKVHIILISSLVVFCMANALAEGGSLDGWNSIPTAVRNNLEQHLGEQRFKNFTRICETHDVFPQMSNTLKNVESAELMDITFVSFLTSVGNALGQQGIMKKDRSFLKDAVEVFRVAIDLKPDHFPARMGLVAAHTSMGNTADARSTARGAIKDIDAAIESGPSSQMPEEKALLLDMRTEFQTILRKIGE